MSMYFINMILIFQSILLVTVFTAPMAKTYTIFDPLVSTWKMCSNNGGETISEHSNTKEVTILDNKGTDIQTINCPVDQSDSSRPVIIRVKTPQAETSKHYEGRIGDQEIRALEIASVDEMSIILPLG